MKQSGELMSDTPVLFLHGVWHGSWCWSEVLAQVAANGTRTLAVDLAGQGLRARYPAAATRRPFDPALMATEPSPLADIGLDETSDLLLSQIKTLGGGGPVVVVAHSAGGATLTRVAQMAPDLVAHAVYLSAAMPPSGVSALECISSPESEGNLAARLLVADPGVIGAMRMDPMSDDPEYQELFRMASCGDVEPEVALAVMRLLTPDAPIGPIVGTTTLTADGWGRVPRSFVICTQDRGILPALARKMIADADAAFPDNPTTVYTLDSSHSPFLSMPGKLAEIIGKVLAAQSAS
jgi:pimeloyl-ACP methyl ester carboxylesterase